MNVVYYKMVTIEGTGKRMAKFTAILRMISDRRGIIESVKIRPMDIKDKISPEYMKELIQKELGTSKNIKSCYSHES